MHYQCEQASSFDVACHVLVGIGAAQGCEAIGNAGSDSDTAYLVPTLCVEYVLH
jgi:hypothetical protein